jgi:hypothetical protein
MEKQLEAQLTKNITAMTDGGKLALVLCAGAFRFGGNWGFIRSSKADFRGQLETLKEERPNVKAIPLANGALVVSNENFLSHNVNLAVPNAIDGLFVDKANARKAEEKKRFQKFIENIASGKSTHLKFKKTFYEVTIGIYCVNDTNAIRLNGVDYPAYKLTLIEALEYANQLTATGKKVYARAVDENGKEVFDLIQNLAGNSKGVTALYKGLEIAESETGVFLTLRIV